ncbi:MAG TPA: adenosylcobinamide-GDP ribazoletransferase [Polyangiales bacterium]|nr:adenosylcobinamide-GDP ribazoletransferase [Polyangiales bacterium]
MLAPLRLAFAFLTRLPLPAPAAEPAQLGAAVSWFPLVGLVLGAVQYLSFSLLHTTLDPLLLGVALVSLHALLSGALHLDGLADVFDGLSGGRGDRARTLEIMRDPRLGAHGACALVLCLLGKCAASSELCQRGDWQPLLAAPVCARFAAVLLIRFYPYARPEGLGRAFHDHSRGKHVLAAALLGALGVGWLGLSALGMLAVALVIAAGIAFWVQRRIGGLTGDAYGAAIELAELGVLVAGRWL